MYEHTKFFLISKDDITRERIKDDAIENSWNATLLWFKDQRWKSSGSDKVIVDQDIIMSFIQYYLSRHYIAVKTQRHGEDLITLLKYLANPALHKLKKHNNVLQKFIMKLNVFYWLQFAYFLFYFKMYCYYLLWPIQINFRLWLCLI